MTWSRLVTALMILAVSALAAVLVHEQRGHPGGVTDPGADVAQAGIDTGIDTGGDLIGSRRPGFHLEDHLGRSHRADDWDGQLLVVNFWATWCLPCRREIPAFIELQEAFRDAGVQFVGIALDTPNEVRAFFDEHGIEANYPMLVGGEAGIDLARVYGNRFGILPYTVIVDRGGRIAFIQYGEMSHEQARQGLLDLL